MPRKSPEARSAALFSILATPPKPPADLSPEGQDLWRATVRERPGDWWTPISAKLLHVLIQQLCMVDDMQRRYDLQDPSMRTGHLLKEILATSANCASISARLRLTPQQQIDRRSGRITEQGLGDAADDSLLGGRAAWGARDEKAEG
jgi:hypothetical protein